MIKQTVQGLILIVLLSACNRTNLAFEPTAENCKNHPSFESIYSSGWSSGFNSGSHNNIYQDENSRKCYEWGYTIGKMKKSELDLQKQRSDSFIYQSCLSNQLLNPNIICTPPAP
ncbi:hypothetical protein CWATWH0402_3106 [Crocosphaera watsonii WH 0402]|uniref:Lipoprotein n=1 Tax=Crocosphaera watsonii WH 0402 TaxID=1284629 RepID=T2JL59_CROWT|nr:hypothetical protein [Crocosphaera watsonii]CCQ65242.1 hypothetical protein CWATWH0402_3106 [Crocosphaera watsonii WH 0402]